MSTTDVGTVLRELRDELDAEIKRDASGPISADPSYLAGKIEALKLIKRACARHPRGATTDDPQDECTRCGHQRQSHSLPGGRCNAGEPCGCRSFVATTDEPRAGGRDLVGADVLFATSALGSGEAAFVAARLNGIARGSDTVGPRCSECHLVDAHRLGCTIGFEQ
jgi:hypothetical protein